MDPVWRQVHTDYRFAKKKLANPASLLGAVVLVVGFFGVWAAQMAVNLNQDIRQQAQETSYGTRSSGGGQRSIQPTQVIEVGADGVTWENQDAATKANFIATFGSEEAARDEWIRQRGDYLAQQAGVPSATSVDGVSNTNVTRHVYIAGFGWVLPEKAIEFFGDKASTCGVNSAGGVCCPASACSERTVSLASWGTLQPTGSGQVYNCIEGDAGCLRRELAEQQSRGGQIQVTMGSQGELKKTFTSAEELAKAIPADQRTAEENDTIRRQAEQERHAYEAQQLATKIEGALKVITEDNAVSLLKAEEAYKEYCRVGQTGDVAQACRELRAGITEAQELSKKNGELMVKELQALSVQATRALANCIGTNCEKVLEEYREQQAGILAECQSTLMCNEVKERAIRLQSAFTQKYSQVSTVQTNQVLMRTADEYVEEFIKTLPECTSPTDCIGNLVQVQARLSGLVARCEQTAGTNCEEIKQYVTEQNQLIAAEVRQNREDSRPPNASMVSRTVRTTATDLLAGEVTVAEAEQVYTESCTDVEGPTSIDCPSLRRAVDSYKEAVKLPVLRNLDSEDALAYVQSHATNALVTDTIAKFRTGDVTREEADRVIFLYCSQGTLSRECNSLIEVSQEKEQEFEEIVDRAYSSDQTDLTSLVRKYNLDATQAEELYRNAELVVNAEEMKSRSGESWIFATYSLVYSQLLDQARDNNFGCSSKVDPVCLALQEVQESAAINPQIAQLRDQYGITIVYEEPNANDKVKDVSPVLDVIELLPEEFVTQRFGEDERGYTIVIRGDWNGGGSSGRGDERGNIDAGVSHRRYYQNRSVVDGQQMAIVVQELLHATDNKKQGSLTETCGEDDPRSDNGCHTNLEGFVDASAEDGVTFAEGEDSTADINGYARSGAAYVLAPEKLKEEQPEVYNFFKNEIFQGVEYRTVCDDPSQPLSSCTNAHIEQVAPAN